MEKDGGKPSEWFFKTIQHVLGETVWMVSGLLFRIFSGGEGEGRLRDLSSQ